MKSSADIIIIIIIIIVIIIIIIINIIIIVLLLPEVDNYNPSVDTKIRAWHWFWNG